MIPGALLQMLPSSLTQSLEILELLDLGQQLNPKVECAHHSFQAENQSLSFRSANSHCGHHTQLQTATALTLSSLDETSRTISFTKSRYGFQNPPPLGYA